MPSRAFKNLLINLVRRDLTVRYKSQLLGFFWSILKPLAMTAIFYVVFSWILGMKLEAEDVSFTLHLLSGILAWSFFAGATGESMTAVLGNANLIKKVKLPLMVFPLATVCSHFVHFILGQIVLIALLIVAGHPPDPMYFMLLPLYALHFVIVYATCLVLSALNVFFRDVASIWEVLTTGWFYATPIIYPIYQALDKLDSMELGWLKWIYLANPMTPLVLAYRRVFLYSTLDMPAREIQDSTLMISLLICLVMSLVWLWIGCKVFKHYARSFADEV